MAIYACVLIDGDLYWNSWLMGFIPRNGDFCMWFNWWRLLPKWLIDGFYPEKWRPLSVVWLMATSARMIDWWVLSREMVISAYVLMDGDFCQKGWLMGFIPRNGNICQTSNRWASFPRNIYFTISWDLIMGCYPFSGLTSGFLPLLWLD